MRRTGRILVLLAACLMVAAALAGCMAEKKEEAPLSTEKRFGSSAPILPVMILRGIL